MVKIVLTPELRKKETLHQPFSVFGRELALPIQLKEFRNHPEIDAEVETITLNGARLLQRPVKASLDNYRFDYDLELSENAYHSYKDLGASTRPFLFAFFDKDKEVATLAPMCEVGLHAKKLFLISFIDKDQQLASLLKNNKFTVKIAALSITPK